MSNRTIQSSQGVVKCRDYKPKKQQVKRKDLIQCFARIKDICSMPLYYKDRKNLEQIPYMYVDPQTHVIAIRLQSGKVQQVGINGCDFPTLLKLVYDMYNE